MASLLRQIQCPLLSIHSRTFHALLAHHTSSYRYHSRDKPPFAIQVQPLQDSDPSTFHPLHISRILSQICSRGVLEVRKADRNKVIAEMCSYEAANKLVDNKFLSTHKLKALIPLYHILCTGIVRDVPQDISVDLLKESTSLPIKILETI